jgi:hypothetical protein
MRSSKDRIEMKDLGETKFCFSLQLKHLPLGVSSRLHSKNIGEIQYE